MNCHRPTSHCSFRALAALIATFAAALVLATSASAGTYSVYACEGPSSEVLPNSSWNQQVDLGGSHGGHFAFGATCGNLSIAASPGGAAMASDLDAARWIFAAPANTAIAGYSVDRQLNATFPAASSPPKLTASVRESVGSTSTDSGCVGVTIDCNVASSAATGSGLALTSLSVGAGCAEPAGCPNGSYSSVSATLENARVDLTDDAAPSVAALTGTLTNSFTATGTKTLDVSANDLGGGVAELNIAIDGVPSGSFAAGGSCTEPFVLSVPCPASLAHTFSVDVATYATGVHTIVATATDAAGNVSNQGFAAFSIPPVVVPPVDPAAPANGTPAVAAPVAKLTKSKINFKHGGKATISGRLTTADGTPIAGAVLDVASLDLGVFDATSQSAGTVTTAADGSFSVKVRPRGAKRYVVLFKPSTGSGSIVVASALASEKLSLSAKASARRVKPSTSVTISGTLKGAGAAAQDAPVEIDVKIRGKWRAVGVVEAASDGDYRWTYQFVRVKVATRFIFRAQVRRDNTWPWPTETSKQVKVLVAP